MNDFMRNYLQSDTNLWQMKKNLNHVKFTLKILYTKKGKLKLVLQ